MFDVQASFVRFAIFAGGLALFLFLELRQPYRRPSVPKLKRWLINLGVTVFNGAALAVIFGGAVALTSAYVTEHKIGVLNMVAMPYALKFLITLAFMDFMLYVWHILNHVMPVLWRFHRVHHTDLNMDVSTATRFHIGELTISMVIKLGLVYLLGADFLAVMIFETALVLCAQFHHSSLDIPVAWERWIWLLFVPPSMHRIHHSVKIVERNTNYGTIFSLWDRIMGTMLKDVDQDRIKIGVGGHFDEKKLSWARLMIMPFTRYVR